MIGIDVARIKRWYVKSFPDYAGTGYKVVVTRLVQADIDEEHELDGVELDFTVVAYDVNTKLPVSGAEKTGRYSRRHYGGWQAYTGSPGV